VTEFPAEQPAADDGDEPLSEQAEAIEETVGEEAPQQFAAAPGMDLVELVAQPPDGRGVP